MSCIQRCGQVERRESERQTAQTPSTPLDTTILIFITFVMPLRHRLLRDALLDPCHRFLHFLSSTLGLFTAGYRPRWMRLTVVIADSLLLPALDGTHFGHQGLRTCNVGHMISENCFSVGNLLPFPLVIIFCQYVGRRSFICHPFSFKTSGIKGEKRQSMSVCSFLSFPSPIFTRAQTHTAYSN